MGRGIPTHGLSTARRPEQRQSVSGYLVQFLATFGRRRSVGEARQFCSKLFCDGRRHGANKADDTPILPQVVVAAQHLPDQWRDGLGQRREEVTDRIGDRPIAVLQPREQVAEDRLYGRVAQRDYGVSGLHVGLVAGQEFAGVDGHTRIVQCPPIRRQYLPLRHSGFERTAGVRPEIVEDGRGTGESIRRWVRTMPLKVGRSVPKHPTNFSAQVSNHAMTGEASKFRLRQ